VVLSWMAGRAAEAEAPIEECWRAGEARVTPPPAWATSPTSGSLSAACSLCLEAWGRPDRAVLKGAPAVGVLVGITEKCCAVHSARVTIK
jgi:hypothetical protein